MVLVEKVQVDINAGDENGTTPLAMASMLNHLDYVHYLVDHGADITKNDNNGKNAFDLSVISGHMDIIKLFVENHGLDVNKVYNEDSSTPLHLACIAGKLPLVQYLVEKGANVMAEMNEAVVPLDLAALIGHVDVVKWLVEEAGADLYHKNAEGENIYETLKQIAPAARKAAQKGGRKTDGIDQVEEYLDTKFFFDASYGTNVFDEF